MESENSYSPNGQPVESHNQEFAAGATSSAPGGSPSGSAYPATSLQQNVSAAYHPSGVLQLGNSYRTANGIAADTYQIQQPNDSYFASLNKQQASGGGNATTNQ